MAKLTRVLSLESISWSGPQLHIDIAFDGVKFPSTLWYEFNLKELHSHYGDELMERVYFHIAAFNLLKLTSLKPGVIHISDKLSKHYTVEFQELWQICFDRILGQWRFENGMANWKGPQFSFQPRGATPLPAKLKNPQVFQGGTPVDSVAYCGGGKDGLLAVKLLERTKVPFSSFSFSLSQLGIARHQFERAENLLQHCKPTKRHRVTIIDAYLEVLDSDQWLQDLGVKTRAESGLTEVFSILPVMLHYGYRYAVIGNERSANVGNLVWPAEDGKPVNHQWAKSYEAEQTLTQYVRRILVEDIQYYSILQPIHDVLIFALLRQHLDSIPSTHSCNVSPPWCKRCPKCCYVWLCYQAYMPQHVIGPMFDNENLFDVQENQLLFKQMLGLGDQKPFECIGEFREVQLAFELCRRKGHRGRAMELFESEFGQAFDISPILEEYAVVYKHDHNVPDDIAGRVLAEMENAALSIKTTL